MPNIETDSHGNVHVGPYSRSSNGRITVDFAAGDDVGLALDVAATPGGDSARAGIQLGDFFFGQDTAKNGSKNFGLVNAAGVKVAELAAAGAQQLAVPAIAYQFSMPLIIAPDGSFANNGVLTSGTANPLIYLKTYTWFPAGAIVASGAGSAAGWYYTEWTTTTAAIAYNNVWDGKSEPAVPATKVAFVTTGPGSFTGPTTEAVYFTLPMGAATPLSDYRLDIQYQQTNNSNAKTSNVRMSVIGGTVLMATTLTSFLHANAKLEMRLNGVADKQTLVTERRTAAAYLRNTPALAAETSSAAFAFAVCYTKATSTDVCVIENVRLTQSR